MGFRAPVPTITKRRKGRGAAVTRRNLATVAIAAAIIVLTAQPAWAGWTQQITPSPATDAFLNGVSCSSATACVAVGSYTNSSGTFQLAETSNGSAWTESDPANPPGATDVVLNGVSCHSTSCMAVGQNTSGSSSSLVTQLWNGSSWTAKTAQSPAGATSSQFNGVSCAGTGCVAVGSYTTSSGTFPLVEAWNGTSWSLQAPADPAANSQLDGVSCVSATSCEAVGSSQPGASAAPLAEVLSGTSWIVQEVPSTTGSAGFDSVSCPSASSCVATGTGPAGVWNGTVWSLANPHKPQGDTGGLPTLSGVACPTATSCEAAGTFYLDGVQTAVAEQWNGTAWKVQGLTVGDSDTSGMAAVACPVSHECTAVGWWQDSVTLTMKTLAQSFSLSWQDEDLQPLSGTITSSVSDASCGNYCTTAGTALEPGGTVQGFVQYFNGIEWNYRQTASLSYSSFNGIWCTKTEANCVAVGEGEGPTPLAEVFSGIQFTVVPTPLPSGATDGGFYKVSCSSPNDCMAVGFYDVGDNEHGLAETWNGNTWAVDNPPEPAGSTYTVLNSVSCTASSCVAVGNYGDSSDNQQPLIDVFAGGSWTTPAAPLPAGGSSPYLNGVSCPSASACLAVGAYSNGSEIVPLAEKLNGTSWAYQLPPAVPGSSQSNLQAVDCTSASSCEAVGNWYDSSSNSHTLAEGLSGKTWAIQTTPSTGTTSSEFSGVSCPSAINCTGVGDVSGSTPVSVLVEDYS